MNDQPFYQLGLDVGSASIGWALIGASHSGPERVIRAGVRIFDPGVDGDLDKARDESRSAKRRQMRLQRRQARRRAARQRELFHCLQGAGLLPAFPSEASPTDFAGRQAILTLLDQQLGISHAADMKSHNHVAADHVLPYYLRARALDHPLQPYELGRAIYHLGQRRGYKSNRKAKPDAEASPTPTAKKSRSEEEQLKQEKLGEVESGIREIKDEMTAGGWRTLGEFFSHLDPFTRRIRNRWTARKMYEDEFDAIWQAQEKYYPALLTEKLHDRLRGQRGLLYFQRPLMSTAELVGQCELVPAEKRAPWAEPDAQRFRYLQRVNDMMICDGSGLESPLTIDQRRAILDALERDGDQTFAKLRDLIGLKQRGVKFNFERGGEKVCRGNRTSAAMRKVFGVDWDNWPAERQSAVIADWIREEDEVKLAEIGVSKWQFSSDSAKNWGRQSPEPDYCKFSLAAILRLMPYLEDGVRLNAAIVHEFPERQEGGDVYDRLPPLSDLRNPALQRALTELRKLVNAIIREYGKPEAIRIELARDLKKPKKERERLADANRKREHTRKEAAKQILKETGNPYPSGEDIEKFMLAEECKWQCPYSGEKITPTSLFTRPQFQVEHILPISRFPDNSFANKTLCHVSVNLEKSNRTPWEAFHGNSERWDQMLARIRCFGSKEKQRRFQLTAEETSKEKLLGDFTSRQLNDTRYFSKLAGRYLSKLYGGFSENGVQRIFVSSGGVTDVLRRVWHLDGILRSPQSQVEGAASGKREKKFRGDHRHHALDAVVIALTSQRTIQQMARAAERNVNADPNKLYRAFKGIEVPWDNFVPSVREHIDPLLVSHRPNHRLSGALHEETLYSQDFVRNGKSTVRVRKSLAGITLAQVKDIVDPAVKASVEAKLAECGDDIKKFNSVATDPATAPFLAARDGRHIPILSVRIHKSMTPTRIGKGKRERFVETGNNHHTAIFAHLNASGREDKWEGIPVTLLEAMERLADAKRRKQKVATIVDRHPAQGSDWQFKFSLMVGDLVATQGTHDGKDRTGIWKVRSVWSNGPLTMSRLSDSRPVAEAKAVHEGWFPSAAALFKLNARKVTIDLLGRIHEVND